LSSPSSPNQKKKEKEKEKESSSIFQRKQPPSSELLLNCVYAGEGVGVAVSAFKKDVTVYEVDYCAYTELRRPIVHKDQSFTAGSFEVLTRNGQNGVSFFPSPAAVGAVNGMA
jgi:hypothetical protein